MQRKISIPQSPVNLNIYPTEFLLSSALYPRKEGCCDIDKISGWCLFNSCYTGRHPSLGFCEKMFLSLKKKGKKNWRRSGVAKRQIKLGVWGLPSSSWEAAKGINLNLASLSYETSFWNHQSPHSFLCHIKYNPGRGQHTCVQHLEG